MAMRLTLYRHSEIYKKEKQDDKIPDLFGFAS